MQSKAKNKGPGRKPLSGDLQRVLVMITKEQKKLLEEEGKELSLSASAALRQVLNTYFKQKAESLKKNS